MKSKDLKELHTRTREELLKAIVDARAEISKMQIDLVRGTNKNINAVRNKKKDLARFLTIVKEKEVTNV